VFRIKKIHKIIIGTFLGPFLLTFVTVLFLLVMQFIWKHVDDFMGKGLEWYVIAELLVYASANLVTMALPLAILLSSIMTFGELSEHYELVAMKSSGMSLMKILYPIFLVVLTFTVGSYFFGNDLAPKATLKFRTLLYDVTQKKPALELKAGVFYNEIEGYSIRVTKKNEQTGLLSDILIYDHTMNHPPNKKVVRAKEGRMKKVDGFLVMELEDGVSYELNKERQKDGPKEDDLFLRQTFEHQEIRFDLSGFAFERSNESLFKNSHQMLGVAGLQEGRDSLQALLQTRADGFVDYFYNSFHPLRDTTYEAIAKAPTEPLYVNVTQAMLMRGFDLGLNFARNGLSYAKRFKEEKKGREKRINKYTSTIHTKFGIPVGCMLLFFIGAPIGALIKKGGLGMPVVFSIVFFLIFHVLSITGQKMVVGNVVYPAWGMWLAVYFLTPIAAFLTYKSNKDSSLFDSVYYQRIIDTIKRTFKRTK